MVAFQWTTYHIFDKYSFQLGDIECIVGRKFISQTRCARNITSDFHRERHFYDNSFIWPVDGNFRTVCSDFLHLACFLEWHLSSGGLYGHVRSPGGKQAAWVSNPAWWTTQGVLVPACLGADLSCSFRGYSQ